MFFFKSEKKNIKYVFSNTWSQQSPERLVLSHAASAWWDRGALPPLTIASGWKQFIRRGIRSGFCSAD